MKKLITCLMGAAIVCTLNAQTNTFPATGSAGIGTLVPNASSILEMQSTSRGLLVPRMTQAQRNAIAAPATGLLIFQTNAQAGFYFYTGAAWTAVSPNSANRTLSNLQTTSVNQSLNPNADNILDLGNAASSWNDIYADGNTFLGRASINTTSTESFLNLSGTNEVMTVDGTNPYISMENGGADIGYLHASDNDLILATYLVNDTGRVILRANGLERLFVHPTGEVSVNSSTPFTNYELGVNGDIYASSQISIGTTTSLTEPVGLTISGTGSILAIDGDDPYITLRDGAENVGFVQAIGDDLKIGTFATNDFGSLIFRTDGFDRMEIDGDGNFLIGNPSSVDPKAGYKLSVDGKVVCEELRVEVSPWADYVFDENYTLMTIEELEKYIAENNHLPNVPSANHIENEGLHVGEMQAIMMEKIEELTLYIIELKKMNDAFAEKIAQIENQ